MIYNTLCRKRNLCSRIVKQLSVNAGSNLRACKIALGNRIRQTFRCTGLKIAVGIARRNLNARRTCKYLGIRRIAQLVVRLRKCYHVRALRKLYNHLRLHVRAVRRIFHLIVCSAYLGAIGIHIVAYRL